MESLPSSHSLRAQACGKAILTGEHFVVWGGTALAFPVHSARVRVRITATPSKRNSVNLENPPNGDPRLLVAARKACSQLLIGQRYCLSIATSSSFPISSGLGGSAAFSVALCRALIRLRGERGNEDVVAQTALDLERIFHGHPSGIDSTTIAFDTPCFIKTGTHFLTQKPQDVGGPLAGFLEVPPGATFVLAWSGKPGDTRAAIEKVIELANAPGGELVLQRLTAVAESISLQTASALRKADFAFVGAMMDENHLLLRAIEVSTPDLDRLAQIAKNSGALGAKMTGGGLGGFMLALAWPDQCQAVAQALRLAGSPLVLLQPTDEFAGQ